MPKVRTVTSQQRPGGRATTVPPVPGHLVVQYHGIDRCDRCGQPLEDGQWLVGLCRACEQKANRKYGGETKKAPGR